MTNLFFQNMNCAFSFSLYLEVLHCSRKCTLLFLNRNLKHYLPLLSLSSRAFIWNTCPAFCVERGKEEETGEWESYSSCLCTRLFRMESREKNSVQLLVYSHIKHSIFLEQSVLMDNPAAWARNTQTAVGSRILGAMTSGQTSINRTWILEREYNTLSSESQELNMECL